MRKSLAVLMLLHTATGVLLRAQQVLPQTASALRKTQRVGVNAFRVPVVFERNDGQAPDRVRFLVHKLDYTAFFLDDAVVFSSAPPPKLASLGLGIVAQPRIDVVTMQLVGAARQTPQIETPLRARGTFMGGRDGQRQLTLSSVIKYRGIYPGIDLRFRDAQGRMRYDFTLGPQANAQAIRFHFREARSIQLDARGNLVVRTESGILRQSAPIVYATAKASRRTLQGRFIVLSATDAQIVVTGARAGETVHIDPEIVYSTYLGGYESTAYSSNETDTWVSAYGNKVDVYFQVAAAGFPGAASVTQSDFAAVLFRFDCSAPQNPTVDFMVVFPSIFPRQLGLSSASDGSVYVLGAALPSDPLGVPPDALQSAPSQIEAPFIARVEQSGTVSRMTYLWSATPKALSVEANGPSPGVYVTGSVAGEPINMGSLPPYMQNPVQPPKPNDRQEVVVLKLDLPLRQVKYVTFIGGTDQEIGVAIAAQGGKASILSYTGSTDYPTTSGTYQSSESANAPKTFLTSLDGAGGLTTSGFVGYWARGLEIYSNGDIASGGYRHISGGDPPYSYSSDAVKLVQPANALGFRSVTLPDYIADVAPDNGGGIWAVGITSTQGQATGAPAQPNYGGGIQDGFVALFNNTGMLDQYTYLGGNGSDRVSSVARGSSLTFVAGRTNSANFPVTPATAYQPTLDGVNDTFFAILGVLQANVNITKTGTPSQINQNGHVTYTVQITNSGTGSSSGLTIVEQADPSLVLLPPQWQTNGQPAWSNGSSNTFISNGVSLSPGQSVTFTIQAVGVEAGSFQNCATVYSGTSAIATACDGTTVQAPTDLAVSIADDASGSAAENTPINFTVTVTNLGSAAVSNVHVQHRPIAEPNLPVLRFTQAYSPSAGSFTDANFGDADGYTWVFSTIEPGEAARIFASTAAAKGGRYQTQATATIVGSLNGPWSAVSMTNVGNVVAADLNVAVHAPAPGPPNLQKIDVDVKNLTPTVALPSFQLQVEIEVDQMTFPALDASTPDGGLPTNVGWFDQPGSTPGRRKWVAVFNVNPNFQTGVATIRIPSSAVVHSIRATASDFMIIDVNGAVSVWP